MERKGPQVRKMLLFKNNIKKTVKQKHERVLKSHSEMFILATCGKTLHDTIGVMSLLYVS